MVNNIFLIGFSGSGKSTIGPKLASKLNSSFVDLDDLIIKKAKKPIQAIFSENGEKAFRKFETEIIENIISQRSIPKVIALGGGAFEKPANRRLIAVNSIVIYLSCSQRVLYQRLKNKSDRPLLNSKQNRHHSRLLELRQNIRTLLSKRLNNYKKADITVSTTNKSVNDIVREISLKLKKLNAAN